jgi:rod shape-determining protein MreD
MPLNNTQGFGIYVLSIIVAMALRIAPWPMFIHNFNPDWVLLVLIYWCLAIPERMGIFNAWTVGLLTDVLTGRMLGQYALTYALVCYLSLKLHRRLQRYPLLQQSVFIFFFLLFSQMLIFWTENIQSPTHFQISFWIPAITGTLSWSIFFFLFRGIRFYRKIS